MKVNFKNIALAIVFSLFLSSQSFALLVGPEGNQVDIPDDILLALLDHLNQTGDRNDVLHFSNSCREMRDLTLGARIEKVFKSGAPREQSSLQLTDGEIATYLLPLLADPNYGPYKIAALNYIRGKKPTDPAIHMAVSKTLGDKNQYVRSSAVSALRWLKPSDPKIHMELMTRLSDSSPDVRSEAAEALGEINCNSEQVATLLGRTLNDEYPSVRASAAWALGKLKPIHSIDVHRQLVFALSDREEDVRFQAGRSLIEIYPELQRTLGSSNYRFQRLNFEQRGKVMEVITFSTLFRMIFIAVNDSSRSWHGPNQTPLEYFHELSPDTESKNGERPL